MTTDIRPIRRALISVSDKSGVTDLAAALVARGVEIVSTGGTAAALRAAGFALREVAELTGVPEMLGGRVKTLHPAVHGGLLARRDDPEHMATLAAQGIGAIDLLVVNLYPFEATVAAGAAPADCVEEIDIGGPAMIRAAAKNHDGVAVLVDTEDYPALLAEIAATGGTSAALRQRLAATAFARTAAYDAAVSGWMAAQIGDAAPRRRVVAGTLVQTLRYGENPHQRGAFYRAGGVPQGLAAATLRQGKELSWNNLNDASAALALIADLVPGDGPACAIIKHANPCGVARGRTLAEAYARAHDCDRTSVFGGIVAVNGRLDGPTAEAITAIFTEVVLAPEADADALAVFAARPALRLLTTGGAAITSPSGPVFTDVSGGFLVQDRDAARVAGPDLRVVTRRAPEAAELSDMIFAMIVAKHAKSNAIIYAKDGATVGVGAGQMSRVDSVRIAAAKAEEMGRVLGLPGSPARGAVVASDAFFPFADGLMAAAEAGVTAVIQPGGSLRDAEVIAAADAAGLAMVFTGQRHFRH